MNRRRNSLVHRVKIRTCPRDRETFPNQYHMSWSILALCYGQFSLYLETIESNLGKKRLALQRSKFEFTGGIFLVMVVVNDKCL